MKMAKRVDYVGQADHLTKGSQHPSHVGTQICSIKQHTFKLAFLLYYHLPKTSLSFFISQWALCPMWCLNTQPPRSRVANQAPLKPH